MDEELTAYFTSLSLKDLASLPDVGVGLSADDDGQTHPVMGPLEVHWLAWVTVALTVFRVLFQGIWTRLWLKMNVGDAAAVVEKQGISETPDERLQRAQAAAESAYKALYYSAVWYLGWISIYDTHFWKETRECYVGWPVISVSPALKLFTLLQCAFYAHSFLCMFTIEKRRKDFLQMVLHHVITTILIAGAYKYNYHRIGGVLLFTFDGCDIALELGKVCLYAGFHFLSVFFISVLLLMWWSLRVYFYATTVCYSGFVEAKDAIGPDMPYHLFFNSLLFILLVLNFYWGYLITRIAVRKVLKPKSTISDSREKAKTQ